MPKKARTYVNGTIVLGILVLAAGLLQWKSVDLLRYASYLGLGLAASTLKVRLPKIRGSVSGGFIFVLIGIADFTFAETLVIAWATGLVQCVWKANRRQVAQQLLFNLATLGNSAAAAYWLPRLMLHAVHYDSLALLLVLAASLYFWINNISVLTVLALVEDKPLMGIWRQCSIWSYWYFLVQAALAGIISTCIRSRGWVVTVYMIVLLLGGYLIFKRVANTFSTRKQTRRRAKRYDSINATVQAAWTGRAGSKHVATARVIDVSEMGMRIECQEPIAAGTVHISSSEHNIDNDAEVCYCEFRAGKYSIGLEFHLLLKNSQLMSLLYTREAPPPRERLTV
jgi:PilZ domain-containing protein